MEESNLGWYVGNSIQPLIESVKPAERIKYNNTANKKELKQKDKWKEGPMKKQKNVWTVYKRNARNNRWKRNAVLGEKTWLESWNISYVVCCTWTSNSNKICETQDG